MDPTILVVEDDPDLRTLLRRVLERAGYRVREAADGVEALEEVVSERPALVLTDLVMPRLNGDVLVALLMQDPETIPCILMSAFHSQPLVEDVPFLPKPFAIGSLLELVTETLERRTGVRRRSARP